MLFEYVISSLCMCALDRMHGPRSRIVQVCWSRARNQSVDAFRIWPLFPEEIAKFSFWPQYTPFRLLEISGRSQPPHIYASSGLVISEQGKRGWQTRTYEVSYELILSLQVTRDIPPLLAEVIFGRRPDFGGLGARRTETSGMCSGERTFID